MTNRGLSTSKLDVFDGAWLTNESLRSIIADLQVPTLIQGPESEILYCNRAAAELLGITEDEMPGNTLFDPQWDVRQHDGRPFPLADHPAARVLRTGQSSRNVVMGVHRVSRGDLVWLDVNAYPLVDSDGSVSRVLCAFSDIGARGAAMAQSRRAVLRAQLGAILSGRERSLQSIMNAAAEALVVHLDADRAWLWIPDKDDGQLRLQVSAGSVTTGNILAENRVQSLNIEEIARRHQSCIIDIDGDSRFGGPSEESQKDAGTLVVCPLMVEGSLISLLGVLTRRSAADEVAEDLASISDILGLGIERKRAEESLALSEEFANRILEICPDCVKILDLQGNLLY